MSGKFLRFTLAEAKGFGEKLDRMLRRGDEPAAIKKVLLDAYSGASEKAQIEALSDEEVLSIADKERRGLHVATPVFDGAHEDRIRSPRVGRSSSDRSAAGVRWADR